ncbi:Hypothetical protein NTJ_14824 [Nesidiocoris tenuis]|uniref:Uncharacterized protein n=1 Tax=Nesidiocoris tenuis TaxID=355587 RepID=A0ABN7BCA0_9HEMI|nr:Hypothetical protein NTJ_14824 [Nesidiocoris tenuis]
MEYYLTTYTKDYKWPVNHSPVKEMKEAETKEKMVHEQTKPQPCSTYQPQNLEDPQIDPAQCGAPPAGPESKFGQPLTYLRKLYLKYPYLYQILKLTPPEELAKTVYGDKFVSTYASDYKVEGFAPMKGWLMPEGKTADEAVKAGIPGVEPAKEEVTPPPHPDDKAVKFVGGQQGTRMGKWKSEYRDTISKMGAIIIQKKLLARIPPELKTTIDK